MTRAKRAMDTGVYSDALEASRSVLEQQSDNVEAMRIKARAELSLGYFENCTDTLDRLLSIDPDDESLQHTALKCAFQRIENLLTQSDTAETDSKAKVFEESVLRAKETADWFEKSKGKSEFHSFIHARCCRYRIQLLQSKTEKVTISGSEQPGDADRQAIIKALHIELDRHLESALNADPENWDAYLLQFWSLQSRRLHHRTWRLAGSIALLDELPTEFAEEVVNEILQIGDRTYPQRVELGFHVLDAVPLGGRESVRWKLTAVRLHQALSEWDKAKPYLHEILAVDPTGFEGRFQMAHNHYGRDDLEGAITILRKLAAATTDRAASSMISSLRGRALMGLGRINEASQALRNAIEYNPDNPSAREGLLELLAIEGALNERDIDDFLTEHASDGQAARVAMRIAISNGKPDEIRSVIEHVAKIHPLSDEHLRVLAEGHGYLQEFNKAESHLRELARRHPTELAPHLELAKAMLSAGKFLKVEQMLSRVHGQLEGAPGLNELLGQLFADVDPPRAIKQLRDVIKTDSSNITARLLLAQVFASLSNTHEALALIRDIHKIESDQANAHALAHRIYRLTGNNERADEHLAAIDLTKLDGRYQDAIRAQRELKAGRHDQAVLLCRRGILEGNQDPVLRLLLIDIYNERGEADKVERQMLGLVKSQPGNPRVFEMLTGFYLQRSRVLEGVAQLDQLKGFNEALANLAQAKLLNQSGLPEAALMRLETALKKYIQTRDVRSIEVADQIAAIHVKQGRRGAAADLYQQLITAGLTPVRSRLARIKLLLNDNNKADLTKQLDALTEKLGVGDRQEATDVIQLWIKLRRFDRAIGVLNMWLAADNKQADVHRWKGDLLLQSGQVEAGINAYESAILLEPERTDYQWKLANAQIKNTDFPRAKETFMRIAEVDPASAVRTRVAIGRTLAGIGLNLQAKKWLNQLEPSEVPVTAVFSYGEALTMLNQNRRALAAFDRIGPKDARYVMAQLFAAQLELRNKAKEAARSRIEKLARSPKYRLAAVRGILALKGKGRNFDELARWCDECLEVTDLPASLRLKWMDVQVAMRANEEKWNEVKQLLEVMKNLHPENVRVRALQIALLVYLDEWDHATQHCKSFPETESDIDEILESALMLPGAGKCRRASLGAVLGTLAKGNHEDARAIAERIESTSLIYKSDVKLLFDQVDAQTASNLALAEIALNLNLPQLSKAICKRVAERYPNQIVVWQLRARAALRLNESIEPLVAALKRLLPDTSLALHLTALQDASDGNREKAVTSWQALLVKQPHDDTVKYQLARALREAGQIDEAIGALESTLDSRVWKGVASNDLAFILAKHRPKQIGKAHRLALRAMDAMPNAAAVRDTLGWIEHLRGNNIEAVKHLQRALPITPNDAMLHYHLGIVYSRSGHHEWAIAHLRQGMAGDLSQDARTKSENALTKLVKNQ